MTQLFVSREELLKRVRRQHPTQVRWRRHLHQHPEIANQEFETTAFLKQELKRLGLKLLPLKMKTGVLAELKGSRPGPTVAIRSDIDALPMDEKSGLKYASRNKGRMHACGHDFHMATVLGTAAVLAEMRKDLAGSVRFIFQPAEEDPPGGAKPMIENGALRGVSTIFGLHVDPHIPSGKIGLCDGPMMAMVCDFDLIIKGRGSHVARPQFAVDAITTAVAVVEALQKIVSRENDPSDPLVLAVGQIQAGTARNVIADRAELICTARTLSPRMGKKIKPMIRRTVGGICRAHGATFEMIEAPSYPILVNDPATNKRYADIFGWLFSPRDIIVAEPALGGEDFAYFLEQVPGAMLRLGIKNKKIGSDKPWHASDFKVDDEAIYHATALLTGASLSYLEENR